MIPSLSKWLIGTVVVAALGCSDDDGPTPVFPENYAETYTEVRDCRLNGGSHDFNYVRVLADPAAFEPYRDRMAPFPVGSVVVKEQYDSSDADCSGDIVRWTAMERIEGSEDTLNWYWQDVDAKRKVVSEDLPRCYGCHLAECEPPIGYEGTCTVP